MATKQSDKDGHSSIILQKKSANCKNSTNSIKNENGYRMTQTKLNLWRKKGKSSEYEQQSVIPFLEF